MKIIVLFTQWLDLLAGLVTDWRMRAQARKSVIVTQDGGCFTVRRSGNAQSQIIANVAAGTRLTSETAQALRDHFIIFELAPDKVVTRRLSVPLQAQDFLQGIVSNQIERLSPWPPAQAVYAIDAKPSQDDRSALNISVLIAARASIDAICTELTASGMSPHRVTVRTDADLEAPSLTLWTRPSQTPQQSIRSLPQMIGAGLTATVLLSLIVSLWAVLSANGISAEADDVAERIEALEQHNPGSNAQYLASLSPPERAWALKESSPVAVLTLEALSRALPETAYLTELHLENATLRIIGVANDAPSLIGALEKSGGFSQVHFFAPTTKGQSGQLYKFYIETRVDAHPAAVGD